MYRTCVVAEGFSMVSTIPAGVSDIEPTCSGLHLLVP